LGFLGLALTGISMVAVPISIAWLMNALWLGRKQERFARAETETSVAPVPAM
jgi:AAA family ATP:ADP antiporter